MTPSFLPFQRFSFSSAERCFLSQLRFLPLWILFFLMFSCKSDKGGGSFIPSVTGSMNEVLVIMPKYQWEGKPGEILRETLARPITSFSQPEPLFNLVHIPMDAFNGVFTSHRNLLFVQIGAQSSKPEILVSKDKWARPQFIAEIKAPNDSAFMKMIEAHHTNLEDRILTAERNRALALHKKSASKEIKEMLLKKYQIALDIPKSFSVEKDSGGFVWLEEGRGDNIIGLFIWTYPYTDTAQLSQENLLKKRNEVLKRFVPGGPAGSYMTTEALLKPEFRRFSLDNHYYAELSGLWTLEKGFMGGPFVTTSTVDEKRGRIISMDAWVYAPNQNERNWLYHAQYIAYTLQYPD